MTASDRSNLLLDLVTAISELKTKLVNVNARSGKNNLATIELTVDVSDTAQLEQTAKRLKHIDSVLSVVRRRQ